MNTKHQFHRQLWLVLLSLFVTSVSMAACPDLRGTDWALDGRLASTIRGYGSIRAQGPLYLEIDSNGDVALIDAAGAAIPGHYSQNARGCPEFDVYPAELESFFYDQLEEMGGSQIIDRITDLNVNRVFASLRANEARGTTRITVSVRFTVRISVLDADNRIRNLVFSFSLQGRGQVSEATQALAGDTVQLSGRHMLRAGAARLQEGVDGQITFGPVDGLAENWFRLECDGITYAEGPYVANGARLQLYPQSGWVNSYLYDLQFDNNLPYFAPYDVSARLTGVLNRNGLSVRGVTRFRALVEGRRLRGQYIFMLRE